MSTFPQARQLGRSASTADQLVELVDEMNRAADCIQRLEAECRSRQQQLARRKKAHLATIHQARQWKAEAMRCQDLVTRMVENVNAARERELLECAARSQAEHREVIASMRECGANYAKIKAQRLAAFFAAFALLGWLF